MKIMKPAYSSVDTIAAVATPPGAGAIGIVRVSGPLSPSLASSLIKLSGPKPLDQCDPRQIHLGLLHDSGAPVDQVMAVLFRAPQSYTGEDVLEIYCHGGGAVLKRALDLVLSRGARPAEPGEFSQRAFLNGKLDLAQAEAVADMIAARTEPARAAAWSQMQGSLSRKVQDIRGVLLELLAHLEVNLDHSDDATVGPTLAAEAMAQKLNGCNQILDELLRGYEYGRLLKEGVRVAIVGRPNVGKSSLLNRLLRSDRAIVTDVPGTTRDTLEEGFDLFGIPAVLIDTAGIRDAHSDPVEKIGIERTHRAIEEADLVLALFDRSEPLAEGDRTIAALLRSKNKKCAVLNKSDLPTKINPSDVADMIGGGPVASVSSLSGAGIEDLLMTLKELASSRPGTGTLDAPPDAAPLWVTSVRHRDCLARARASLERAQDACKEADMDECTALEIREALDALGELVGETVTEDVLNEIFSRFCIGK